MKVLPFYNRRENKIKEDKDMIRRMRIAGLEMLKLLFILPVTCNVLMVVYVQVFSFMVIQLAEMKSSEYMPNFVQIHGTITQESTARIIREIKALENDTTITEILIDLASPGGWAAGGRIIRQELERCRKPIEIRCSYALSSAVDILLSGTKGRRFIYEDAEVMIHRTRLPSGIPLRWYFSLYVISYNHMEARFISKKTGQPFRKVAMDMNREVRFWAAEAVTYGFADSVITQNTLDLAIDIKSGR